MKLLIIFILMFASATHLIAYDNKIPSKSKRFAELMYKSSLDEEAQEFIIYNLDSYSDAAKKEWYKVLLKDVRENTDNKRRYQNW
ncbi:MAG: hypothetical protein U9N59_15960 [Campylobacterota bacterium]|nr:hypothetical protein [Campylobacterota bacterium]